MEMLAGGFSAVEVKTVVHQSHYPSLKSFWESLQRSMAPVVLLRDRLGAAAFEPVAHGVYERLARHFGEGAQTLPLTANFGVGVR